MSPLDPEDNLQRTRGGRLQSNPLAGGPRCRQGHSGKAGNGGVGKRGRLLLLWYQFRIETSRGALLSGTVSIQIPRRHARLSSVGVSNQMRPAMMGLSVHNGTNSRTSMSVDIVLDGIKSPEPLIDANLSCRGRDKPKSCPPQVHGQFSLGSLPPA